MDNTQTLGSNAPFRHQVESAVTTYLQIENVLVRFLWEATLGDIKPPLPDDAAIPVMLSALPEDKRELLRRAANSLAAIINPPDADGPAAAGLRSQQFHPATGLAFQQEALINDCFQLVVLHNNEHPKRNYQLHQLTPGCLTTDANPRWDLRAAFALPDEFFAYLSQIKFNPPEIW
jgi:hypothetical protein